MVREWCSCKSLPNKCSSLFWQERPGSQSTALSFWGPSPGWGGRFQLAAPSGPGPQTLHNCYHWGSQAPRMQPTLRFLRLPKWWGPGPIDCVPCGLPLPLGQRWEGGRGSPPPQGLGQGQRVALARALEPCRTQPPACSLGPQSTPAGPRPGKLERRIHLLPHCPPEDHHSTARRLLAESSQLTVSPWQPAACGRGSLQCWPMTEQDHQTVSFWQLVACGRGPLQCRPITEQGPHRSNGNQSCMRHSGTRLRAALSHTVTERKTRLDHHLYSPST